MSIVSSILYTPKPRNPYAEMSKDELLGCFRSNKWETLSNPEKVQLLQATGDMYAKEHGILKPPFFAQEKNGERYGGYNSRGNQIKINLEKCSNPYEALDTVAHEENHAYQCQCIKYENGKYSEQERALIKAENGSAYVSFGITYHRQSIEADSNNAGAGYTLSERSRFQDDPAYREYLRGRAGYFEIVGNDYEKQRLACDNSELNQVSISFSNGEISKEERNSAEECIYSNSNSIKEESSSLRREIKQSYVECVEQQEQYVIRNMSDEQKREYIFQNAKQQHLAFDEEMAKEDIRLDELAGIQIDNSICRKNIQDMRTQLTGQRADKMKELGNYIRSNNMEQYETHNDSYCRSLSSEINDLDQQISNCNYYDSLLETDSQLIEESTVRSELKETAQESFEEDDGLNDEPVEEESESDMDDGLSENEDWETEDAEVQNMDDGLGEENMDQPGTTNETGSMESEGSSMENGSSSGMDSGSGME